MYVDTYYGRKVGMAPTTAAVERAGRAGKQPWTNWQDVGDGIYVTSWLGGNADSTTGDFSLGLRGHLIENGAIGAPVGEMNVTGNLQNSSVARTHGQRCLSLCDNSVAVARVRRRRFFRRVVAWPCSRSEKICAARKIVVLQLPHDQTRETLKLFVILSDGGNVAVDRQGDLYSATFTMALQLLHALGL